MAGVDEKGEVTARFVGETIIDVKADEGSAEFMVTVNGKVNTTLLISLAMIGQKRRVRSSPCIPH